LKRIRAILLSMKPTTFLGVFLSPLSHRIWCGAILFGPLAFLWCDFGRLTTCLLGQRCQWSLWVIPIEPKGYNLFNHVELNVCWNLEHSYQGWLYWLTQHDILHTLFEILVQNAIPKLNYMGFYGPLNHIDQSLHSSTWLKCKFLWEFLENWLLTLWKTLW
jgi:hypothetical protein